MLLQESLFRNRSLPQRPEITTPGRSFRACVVAREALAAWTCFDYPHARAEAESAARHSRSWSPLKLLMSLIPEE